MGTATTSGPISPVGIANSNAVEGSSEDANEAADDRRDPLGDSEETEEDKDVPESQVESDKGRKLTHGVREMKCPTSEELREHNRTHSVQIMVSVLRRRPWPKSAPS